MGWLLLAYLQNFRPQQIVTFQPSQQVGLFHFWSLAVEEQFYLVWPAAVFFIRGKKKLFFTTLLISAAALLLRLALIANGASAIAIHVNTLCRADSLLLGGTLALLYRSRYWPRVLRAAPFGLLAATLIILVSIGLIGVDPIRTHAGMFWTEGFRYTVLALGFASLLAWALRPQSIARWFFELSPLRFCGKYSYGIYVLHVIFLPFFISYFRAAIFSHTHSKLLAVVGAGFISLTIGIVAAYLSYHLFEKRFLRLKRFFDYDSPSQPPSSTQLISETVSSV
jgi:peptidoglycan/LPS O-acetylase OafA/YrhL